MLSSGMETVAADRHEDRLFDLLHCARGAAERAPERLHLEDPFAFDATGA